MKQMNKIFILLFTSFGLLLTGCDKDSDGDSFDTSGTYTQKDQMARPAIATVFVGADRKDEFNMTPPSMMEASFKTDIVNKLTAFGFTENALGQTKDQFATLLATDVLNVKLNGPTTFFDGTNVLTGRALADDVIDTELLLIFGGPTGTSNPGLTTDNVNANDKSFLSTFPFLADAH
ncbi:MAG: DUF4331 family protein [Chitinophagaceae bacterium]|nr:DUF4331 family protein [Chitinophagaceae bacterium]